MHYRERLSELIAGLERTAAVVVEDCYLGEGLRREDIAARASERGIRLATSIAEFYSQINGAIIQWRCNPDALDAVTLRKSDDTERINGLVYLYTLDEMLEEWTNLQNSPYAEGLEDKSRISLFHPFDKNVEEAFAGFLIEDGFMEDKLYYLRQDEELIPFEASIETYLEALAQARGFLWWQEAFVTRPRATATDDLYYYVPQLFRGESLHLFKSPGEE